MAGATASIIGTSCCPGIIGIGCESLGQAVKHKIRTRSDVQHNAQNLRTPKHEAAAAVQHNAHTLRTPKHEGLYRYGRRCGRHNPC
jgi:hypothetical protein